MEVVYRSAVYGFLEFMWEKERITGESLGRRILDCGAGGQRPPIGLFAEHGFEAFGIDLSESQITAAKEFCKGRELTVNLSEGDMRNLPFEDNSFDIVYEFYSMVHLTKEDTLKTIQEMKRVVKNGGLLFFGFASYDTWPITGGEREKGEFWLFEHGDEEVVHSFFNDDEIEDYLEGLEILRIDRRARNDAWWWGRISQEDWMEMYADNWTKHSRKEWERMYEKRSEQIYAHIFYICKKS
ncbi:MAG: class I SAM-dependent methyltransferase [Candidatus Thorarchaeota archaeon]|jgi:SAM-dependent methyltransferase